MLQLKECLKSLETTEFLYFKKAAMIESKMSFHWNDI